MYDQLDNLNITIDKSVKSITRAACMYLSLAIEYGILLTENPTARIVIYDDHIDFGVSMNPMLDMINPNRSLEKVSCHFLMTAIRKIALYMLDS